MYTYVRVCTTCTTCAYVDALPDLLMLSQAHKVRNIISIRPSVYLCIHLCMSLFFLVIYLFIHPSG